MIVAKYPAWTAAAFHEDGSTAFFDGPKDLFKYLFDPARYARRKGSGPVVRSTVTDYYRQVPVDAAKAFFVVGSDLLGPMGHELVPFSSRAAAEEFLADHKGRRVLSYGQVSRDLLEKLDAGRFE